MMPDTRFLELPSGKMLLQSYENVPTRPTAKVELAFVEPNHVFMRVLENKNSAGPDKPGMDNVIARYDGVSLEICHHSYDADTKKSKGTWYEWNFHHVSGRPLAFSTEEEAICWMVLLASDVGCPGQARHDMMEARKSPFWSQLFQEMKDLQPVASVMFT